MSSTGTKPSHFYQRAEFYISVGAVAISLVSLYLSYVSSPLSDVLRPQITYRTVQAIAEPTDGKPKQLRIACEILNPTRNPAEEVVVSIQTDIRNKPQVDVLGGLEYSVLKSDGYQTSVKFPFVPPKSGAVIRLFADLEDDEPLTQLSGDLFLHFTQVTHRHGVGVRER